MIHKVLEEWFDTLLYVGIVIGLVGFFFSYWGNEYSFRHAKVVLQEFLDETAISGKITEEEYSGLNRRLQEIYPDISLELFCYQYPKQKMYDLISKEKWSADFAERNIIQQAVLTEYELQIFQMNEMQLRMQTETNASVFAAEKTEYLPLPKEGMEVDFCAVRPIQEVYEGESLITLCRITDSDGVYYKEAAYIEAQKTGEVLLELVLKDTIYQVPVEVICYPRTELCDKGHCVVNTREVLEEKKVTGKINCPYCSILPAQISCTESELHIKTGETLENSQIGIIVTYLNGSTEYVTPESEEWQDNFDKNYCGIQEVTIRYRDAETKITLISENALCEKCGEKCNDRCYADYVNYPYCLECLSGMYLHTGEIKEMEVLLTQKDIQKELNMKGEILLNRGDLFMVVYKMGKNITMLQRDIKINGKSGIK